MAYKLVPMGRQSNLLSGPLTYYSRIVVKDKEHSLVNLLRADLREGDFILLIVADKNAGKSWTALSLAEDIDPSFCREEDVITKQDDFYATIDGEPRMYSVKVLDDWGSENDAARWASDVNRALAYFFQKSRTMHIGFIITVPDPRMLDLDTRERVCNYWLEITAKDKKRGRVRFKLQKIQVNKKFGDVYYHNLTLGPSLKVDSYTYPEPTKNLSDWYVIQRRQITKDQAKSSRKMFDSYKTKSWSPAEFADVIAADIVKFTKNTNSGVYLAFGRVKQSWDHVSKEKYKLIAQELRDRGILDKNNRLVDKVV